MHRPDANERAIIQRKRPIQRGNPAGQCALLYLAEDLSGKTQVRRDFVVVSVAPYLDRASLTHDYASDAVIV